MSPSRGQLTRPRMVRETYMTFCSVMSLMVRCASLGPGGADTDLALAPRGLRAEAARPRLAARPRVFRGGIARVVGGWQGGESSEDC